MFKDWVKKPRKNLLVNEYIGKESEEYGKKFRKCKNYKNTPYYPITYKALNNKKLK